MRRSRHRHSVWLALPLAAACGSALAADPSFDCSAVEAGSIEARICADEDLAEVERGDQVSLMYLQPSASGARSVGRDESLWEHHGEALVSWGCGSPEMKCVRQ